MKHRHAHRGVRSSQATPAAVDKSQGLTHKNSDNPDSFNADWNLTHFRARSPE